MLRKQFAAPPPATQSAQFSPDARGRHGLSWMRQSKPLRAELSKLYRAQRYDQCLKTALDVWKKGLPTQAQISELQ